MQILLIFLLPFLYLFLFYIFKILKTSFHISLYSRTNDFSFGTILNFVFKTPYNTWSRHANLYKIHNKKNPSNNANIGTPISIKSTLKSLNKKNPDNNAINETQLFNSIKDLPLAYALFFSFQISFTHGFLESHRTPQLKTTLPYLASDEWWNFIRFI